MTAVEKVIDLAKSEVGYLEKASNHDLDSKTANAGYNNWTKYARDLDNENFYNTKKNGFAWCDVFVDWLLYKCFGLDNMMKMTGQPKGISNSGAGCGDSMYFYRQIGQVFTSPQPGDQIFFWNSTKTAKGHTGLVIKVDGKKVYTIEGNTSSAAGVVANGGCVCEKCYDINNSRIVGYGRPKYELVSNTITYPALVIDLSSWQKGIDFTKIKEEGVKAVILRGGDGNIVDNQFEIFYKNAVMNNLPVGCYWFSRATTVDAAKMEANKIVSMCNGKNIQLPIYIDCECEAQQKLGKDKLTNVILAFTEIISKNNYIPGIYTTENWLNNYIHLNKLNGIERWIAKWSANKPKLDCGMWQFGGETNYLRDKKIAGMIVDQNYLYKDYIGDIDMTRQEVEQLIDSKIKTILDGKDSKPSPWAEEDLKKLVADGITDGTRPGGYATREQVAVMILRAINEKNSEQVIKEIAEILIKSANN